MTPRCSASAWDTEVFGLLIGRIDLEGLDAEAIAAEEADARAAGIEVRSATEDDLPELIPPAEAPGTRR